MFQRLRWLALALVFAALPSWAGAEQVRFRFVPADACGATRQTPIGPQGTMGELRLGLGLRIEPYPYVIKPNQMVTFRHPYTARNVTVPLRLPAATARIEHGIDRITFNYGDYTVQVRFLPDGGADVIYNSGIARPLRFE